MSTLAKTKKASRPLAVRRPSRKTLLAVPRRTPPVAPCSASETAAALSRPMTGFDVTRVAAAAAARDI